MNSLRDAQYRLRLAEGFREEGVPPAFVLEVVSPDSVRRDTEEKMAIYEEMGVLEYAMFGPPVGVDEEAWAPLQRRRRRRWPIDPPLHGWRRDEGSGHFVRWNAERSPGGQDGLWSQELGLWLVVRGDELGLQHPNGQWLRFHAEEIAARRTAEAEVERLRQEIERLRRSHSSM